MRHGNFEKMCVQAAAGNINSCFLCVDDSDYTFVISCGITIVTQEGHPEIEENEIGSQYADKVEQVPSLPYQIDF